MVTWVLPSNTRITPLLLVTISVDTTENFFLKTHVIKFLWADLNGSPLRVPLEWSKWLKAAPMWLEFGYHFSHEFEWQMAVIEDNLVHMVLYITKFSYPDLKMYRVNTVITRNMQSDLTLCRNFLGIASPSINTQ